MSFSNNCTKSDKIPGPMRSNPMNGICEKACIQVNKVFDACIKQETLQNVQLTLTNVTPETGLVLPYKFISAKSVATRAEIGNLMVTPTVEDPCFARVSGEVTIPIQIVFVDANGTEGMGTANVVIPKDVMLHISAPSIMPYSIEAVGNIICPEGTFINADTLVVSACTPVIMRVIMQVDLLVPTYGYCFIPPCQEYTEEVCDGVFDLPLFPQECGVEPRCKTC